MFHTFAMVTLQSLGLCGSKLLFSAGVNFSVSNKIKTIFFKGTMQCKRGKSGP